MLHPEHRILAMQYSEDRSRRMKGWAVVGLFHILFVWALVSGLAVQVVRQVEHHLTGEVFLQPDKPMAHTTAPPVKMVTPGQSTVDPVMPVITIISDPGAKPLVPLGPPATPTPDSGAAGISGTHTIPRYPLLAIRMGEHGTVQLHLSVSVAGDVTAAAITRSSGFADLDQGAVNWVIAHWKYRPAIQNGAAVPSGTDAAVVFDLKNAQ